MQIPFLNFEREVEELIKIGLMTDIENVIRSGCFLFGPKMGELEMKLSELFERPVVMVGSGTDALALSLKALGIGNGDLVAVPMLSAIPTAIAVKMIGAKPIYVDVDGSFTMDPERLRSIVAKHDIKAVIPVHLYGNPANIVQIKTICQENNLVLIEDCAQSFGARGRSGWFGTYGMAGAFSFYCSKNLGAFGDAGCIVAGDENLAQALRELRFYGQKSKNEMGKFVGMNSRADEIQCVILLKKLQILPALLEKRLEMKEAYDKALTETPFWTPEWHKGAMPHLYPIACENRKDVINKLSERGIETAIHYPFHLEEVVESKPACGEFSMAKQYSKKILSIPFSPWMTQEEIDYVLTSLKEIK